MTSSLSKMAASLSKRVVLQAACRLPICSGAPINSNVADYIMAVNADVPKLEVHFLDYPDKEINPLGARGIGEIGLAGIAAAITAATHHATGVRIRELPITIDKLL